MTTPKTIDEVAKKWADKLPTYWEGETPREQNISVIKQAILEANANLMEELKQAKEIHQTTFHQLSALQELWSFFPNVENKYVDRLVHYLTDALKEHDQLQSSLTKAQEERDAALKLCNINTEWELLKCQASCAAKDEALLDAINIIEKFVPLDAMGTNSNCAEPVADTWLLLDEHIHYMKRALKQESAQPFLDRLREVEKDAELCRSISEHLGFGRKITDWRKVTLALDKIVKDKERLDWLEKKTPLALWSGTFSDSDYNVSLARAGAPICTISSMDNDGHEVDTELSGGDSLRSAIDAIMSKEGK